MRYQYYYCKRYNEKMINFLKENNIKFIPNKEKLDGELISFSIWSNSSDCTRIISELKEKGIESMSVLAEYTKAELQNAKFLVMYPKRQCVDIINVKEAYKFSCEYKVSGWFSKVMHEEQIGLFAIRKEPSSKTKTAFWAEDTGFAEVFTDYRVRELVMSNGLSGIEFKNVMNKKGVFSENIYQMTSSNIIDQKWIGKGYGERKEICHICGKEQFAINNIYQLHLDFSQMDLSEDLYMTERIFGEGIAHPLYIISQRFYRLLRENNLAGGINLSPVVPI